MRIVCVCFAVAAAVAARPAIACSPAEGYVVPTNFELVRESDVIVLAEVIDGPVSYEGTGLDPAVRLHPIRYLKGSAPAAELGVLGVTEWNGNAVEPIVTSLSEAHFSVGLGACVRQFYKRGELVVAMFERDGAALHQAFYPFARAIETVEDQDDIWVHAVEKYLSLQSGDPEGEDGRVRAAVDRLGQQDTIEAAAIRADLIRYLRRGDKAWIPRTWQSRLSSGDAVAFVPADGAPSAVLSCTRGGPMQVMLKGKDAGNVSIRFGPERFETSPPHSTTLRGQAWSGPDLDVVDAMIADPQRLAAAAQRAVNSVVVEADGKTVASAPPSDALFRWSKRCAELGREQPLADAAQR